MTKTQKSIRDRIAFALEDAQYLHIQLERLKQQYLALSVDDPTYPYRMGVLDRSLAVLMREQKALKAGIEELTSSILTRRPA